MYWISDIAFIETESAFQLDLPRNLIFAEPIFETMQATDLPPFKSARGYKFSHLIGSILPHSTSFYISGRDGVSHIYSYDEYLSEAVLIENDGKFDLKSVQMPAGMWIDDIAIIVVEKTAIVFQNQFENSGEIAELLEFYDYPATLNARSADSARKISTNTPFSSPSWQDVLKFSW